jgi:preprotein translocase subunit SecD
LKSGLAFHAVCGFAVSLVSTAIPAMADEALMVFSIQNETVALTVDGIQIAEARVDPKSSKPIVIVRLSRKASASLSEMTSGHVNDTLDIKVCGQLVTSARVLDPIRGRSFQISGSFDFKAAKALADVLQSGVCPK